MPKHLRDKRFPQAQPDDRQGTTRTPPPELTAASSTTRFRQGNIGENGRKIPNDSNRWKPYSIASQNLGVNRDHSSFRDQLETPRAKAALDGLAKQTVQTVDAPQLTDAEVKYLSKIKDIRYDLKKGQRTELFHGPTLSIWADSTFVGHVPLQLAFAASTLVREEYSKNNSLKDLTIRGFNTKMAKVALEWLRSNIGKDRPQVFKRSENMEHDLETILAFQGLGMQIYVQPMVNAWYAEIKRRMPDFEWMQIIEKLAPSDEWGMFHGAAARLAHLQFYDKIQDGPAYEAFMSQNPQWVAAIKPIYEKLLTQARDGGDRAQRDLKDKKLTHKEQKDIRRKEKVDLEEAYEQLLLSRIALVKAAGRAGELHGR
ncbi:hypothetical protein BS50DRAFT_593891 [Corynespora cassiicola Philippines]|uniref:Uncharacterized protein n=1 Tax=Corynespora cassiicola Philippines TaxID=1448308 RepID=A0A2T2N4V8_CORCC|nr:hypothetical protein BS50DRAFT_593891 [Corynespora cassiicola Philippines]